MNEVNNLYNIQLQKKLDNLNIVRTLIQQVIDGNNSFKDTLDRIIVDVINLSSGLTTIDTLSNEYFRMVIYLLNTDNLYFKNLITIDVTTYKHVLELMNNENATDSF